VWRVGIQFLFRLQNGRPKLYTFSIHCAYIENCYTIFSIFNLQRLDEHRKQLLSNFPKSWLKALLLELLFFLNCEMLTFYNHSK